MMFCQYCGRKLQENEVCDCRQRTGQQSSNAGQQYHYTAPQTDNRKIYCILSYISFLWLVGLFAPPERNDPKVRFHVGQGIIKTITTVSLFVIITIISSILRSVIGVEQIIMGIRTGIYVASPFISALISILSLLRFAVVVVFMIIGILNVVNGQDKQLPIIGRFAFYK